MLRAWTCRACLNLLFCDIAGEEETNLLLRLNQKILVDIRTKESLVAVVLHQTKDMILKITRMSSLSFFNGRDSSSTKCAIFCWPRNSSFNFLNKCDLVFSTPRPRDLQFDRSSFTHRCLIKTPPIGVLKVFLCDLHDLTIHINR